MSLFDTIGALLGKSQESPTSVSAATKEVWAAWSRNSKRPDWVR